jgi:repressor LexA
MQAFGYPKCVLPRIIPSWQTIRMQDKAFDIDLVLATMKAKGVTQTAMAKAMGLPSQSAFSNIISGKRRITADEAAIGYRFLGIKVQPNFSVAPVIGITSAGRWREAIEMPLGHMPYPTSLASEAAFGLEVSGDSMNKLIDDGGWVLIDPAKKELHPGSCYLIQNGDHEATVKMYQRSPARFEPCSTNEEHKGFSVADTDFTVIGKVVWKGAPVR